MINFEGENFYDFHRLVYRFPLSIQLHSNSECIAMYVQVLAIILVTISIAKYIHHLAK